MPTLQVLVVEDERIQRMRIAELVRQAGHCVLEAVDAQHALQHIRDHAVDLVLLDVVLPDQCGFDLAEQIKFETAARWVPILFLSGLDEKESRESWMDVGDDFLTKPVDAELLKARLRSMGMAIAHDAQMRRIAQELEREQELARQLMERISFAHQADRLEWVETREAAAQSSSGDCIVAERYGDSFYVLVADAMGHGLAAAVTLIPAVTVFRAMALKGFEPHSIAREINLKLRGMLPRERFISAAIAKVDRVHRTVSVWNGGLPALCVLRHDGTSVQRVDSMAPPLGIVEDQRFDNRSVTCTWQEADVLLMWTDGFTESFGADIGQLHQGACVQLQQGGASVLTDALWRTWQLQPASDDASLVVTHLLGTAAYAGSTPPVALSPRSSRVLARIVLLPSQLRSSLGADSVLAAIASLGLEMLSADALVAVVLSELLANAVDHGLLGLDSALKVQGSQGFHQYYQLRAQRLAALDHGQVDVEVRSTNHPETFEIDVKDTGKGFDHRQWAAQSPGLHGGPGGGRGLPLLRSLCQQLVHLEGGSRTVATLCLSAVDRKV